MVNRSRFAGTSIRGLKLNPFKSTAEVDRGDGQKETTQLVSKSSYELTA